MKSELQHNLEISNKLSELVLKASFLPKSSYDAVSFSSEDLHLFCKYGLVIDFLKLILRFRISQKLATIQNNLQNNLPESDFNSTVFYSTKDFCADLDNLFQELNKSIQNQENWLKDQLANTAQQSPKADNQNLESDRFLQNIVSAATNVENGMITAVARIGTKLPFFGVAERKLRGVTSYGLCLGKSEIGMETSYSSGLVDIIQEMTSQEYIKPSEIQMLVDFLDILKLDSNDQITDGLQTPDRLQKLLTGQDKNNNLQKIATSLTKVYLQSLAINSPEQLLGMSVCTIFTDFYPQDTVLDIKILPDRVSQIGNHLGMALEIARGLGDYHKLTPLSQSLIAEIGWNINTNNSISTEANDGFETVNQNFPKELQKDQNQNFYEFSPDLTTILDDFQKGFQENSQVLTDNPTNDQASAENKAKNLTKNLEIELRDETGIANFFTLTPLKIKKPYTLNHYNQLKMMLLEKNLTGGVADLSNYLLVDIGQPSHFFDLNKVLS